MIKTTDLNWRAIDPGDESTLPPPKYRRWIRVGILTKPASSLIRAGEREFWAFIDRQTSTFYVEEVVGDGLRMMENEDEAKELWEHCRMLGLLRIIIPAESPPLIHFDRETSIDRAFKEYRSDVTEWRREESDQG